MAKSKTHIWAIAIFVASLALVFFDKLGGGEWVTLIIGKFLLLIGRDTVKDENSALKEYAKAKGESIKNLSDSAVADRLNKQ